jgi:SIR2-like domain
MVSPLSNVKVALFLGAGFSKHWGMPLASEIMDFSDLHSRSWPGLWQKSLVGKVERAWIAMRNEHDGVVDEFARLLQTSPSDDLTFDEFAKFIALRFSAQHWHVGTANVTRWGTGDHIRKQRNISAGYSQLLQALRNVVITGIVTTNYDLVVEKLLGPRSTGRLGGFNYGNRGEPLKGRHQLSSTWGYGPISVDGAVSLLKLHGSLNWGRSPTGNITKYIDTTPSRGRRYEAVLLPPGGSTADFILSDIVNKARAVLRNADTWLFCGYSMPSYDQDIVNLLRESTRSLGRIVTLGPDSATISRRILSSIEAENNNVRNEIALLHGPGIDDSLRAAQISKLLVDN